MATSEHTSPIPIAESLNQFIVPPHPAQSERRVRSARGETYHEVPGRRSAEARSPEGRGADVLRLRGDLRDHGEEQLAQALVVLPERLDHLLCRDRLGVLDADIVIRDHGDVRVAELELAREVALG